MPCLYCGSNQVTYNCTKCRNNFCINHSISTETYTCRKHSINYSKEKAKEFNHHCSILPKSNCPECRSPLKIDKLPGGQFFLKCSKCSWDSYSGTPKIHFITQKLVLQEAINNARIVRKPEICGQRLRENKGIEICPNCLIQFLSNGGATSFDTIRNMFNIDPKFFVKVLNKLKNEKRIFGLIDSKNQVFVHIADDAKNTINGILKDEGKIKIEALAARFNISVENAIELMYEILKDFQILGTFDLQKNNYFTSKYLNDWLSKSINDKGRIRNEELANTLHISKEIVKHYMMELLKNQNLKAYFADTGSEIVTKEKLKSEIEVYCKQKGLFKLTEAADTYKVAVELIRKSLFVLIKEKKIRGIFTQKREFITEEELSEKIKGITKAYRVIKLRELARKLGITELRVEEILASLISRGAIYGYIDMNKHEFNADIRQPTTMGPSTIPVIDAEKPTGDIEVVREYDFVGGQLHFKVVTRNNSNMAIHDIRVVLDVPSSYRKQTDFIKIPVIDPHNSRGVDFYLEPGECGISTIGGTVLYKNAMGKPHTIHVRPKDVQIKCPLVVKTLDTIEDIQITIQSLPSDARAFMIADLDPQLAYRAGFRAITNFDTRNVTSLEIPEEGNYQAEAWFSSEAKVTGGRIITRVAVQGANNSLEIRVWCNEAGQLTGFLAKIVEILFIEINMVRKVKAEGRQRTLDVMSITQNLITASDYCAVGYKVSEILLKLEDTQARMIRVLGDSDPIISKIEYWEEKLNKYEEEDKITEVDANSLIIDIENFQNVLARSLTPV